MKAKLPVFTLGVEEEYQIIDPETRDLRSHLSKIVDGAKISLNEQVKAEMHQSVVEVGTNICRNVKEAATDLKNLRSKIVELAAKQNLVVGGAGTHPFSRWQDQPITDDLRAVGNFVVSYTDKVRWQQSGVPGFLPDSIGKSYFLVNARAGVKSTDDSWEIAVYAKNLFNSNYSVFGNSAASYGNILAYGDPRIVGIEANVKF